MRFPGIVAAGIAVAILSGNVSSGVAAERRIVRPLQHHATVFNEALVGSAFAIAPRVAVTNAHVVAGLRPGDRVALMATASGAGAEGRVLAISPRMDLALLSIPDGFLAPIGPDNAPGMTGDAVLAAGVDASGGAALPRRELPGKVSDPWSDVTVFGPGLVLRLPGVRPGFSGGPVLDTRGRLVGMIAAIRPGRGAATVAAYGRPDRGEAEEALVLRAPELRAEIDRLLGR